MKRMLCLLLLAAFLCSSATISYAEQGKLRQLLEKRRAGANKDDGEGAAGLLGWGSKSCLDKAAIMEKRKGRLIKKGGDKPTPSLTVSYGAHKAQAFDVYIPKGAKNPAPYPIILMVHGGGWCIGDKGMGKGLTNKSGRWLPKGFIFISTNYRMIPDKADPLVQAEDVAAALAYVQAHAAEWQGDPDRVIIMGHSAGAHLVSLISADVAIAQKQGVKPWLGTISLDSGSMNVVETMGKKHFGLYDDVFGKDEKFWEAASPFHHISAASPPWFGACSSQRGEPCPQAHAFADKLNGFGIKATVLELAKGHGAINAELGTPGEYTGTVEKFMGELDSEVKKRLE